MERLRYKNGFPIIETDLSDEDEYYPEEMDAVEFLKEAKRMCDSQKKGYCIECPLYKENEDICPFTFYAMDSPEKVVAAVAYWKRHHIEITNRDKFVEIFGKLGYEDRRLIMEDEFGFQKWLEKEYKKPEE